jgi:glycosyltransferase involved in cell wall biosynthesis
MPWWDRLSATPVAVDVEKWKPDSTRRRPGPLVVLHEVKGSEPMGTEFLVRACEELSREGLSLALRLVEHPEAETRRGLLAEADIVADQFATGWYGQLAVEAMSMEKPVLSYLRPDLRELYTLFSYAGDCPIVDTAPGEVKKKLRVLATDADSRAELGSRGRQYVREHHSLEASAAMLDEIFKILSPASQLP